MQTLENIIKENERLIYSATNYFKNYNSKEDLYQAGCMGLIAAYKRFDPTQNCKFTTYAYPFILGEMRALVRKDRGIKVSRSITKLNYKIEKAYILLTQRLMHEPTIKEIADYLEIPEYFVSEALNSTNVIKSIDEPINKEGRCVTFQDIIGESKDIDTLLMLRESLNSLNHEEYNIINNRYFNDLTQTEVSKKIGISQVQVSRKEQKVLKKLKEKMVA